MVEINKGKSEKEEKEREERKKKKITKREGALLVSFTTLVLQSSTMFFIWRVSYVVTFIY